MAYIAPNSIVYLCRKVPFKNDYQHTTIFESATAQYNYFYSKRKYTFTEQSYQRKDNGVIRLNILSDNIIDCNYMMFQNSNFSNKWFYAFITNVEYVNNAVSNVYYEIDVMQTWLFNYNLRRCFVEREHTVSDNPGEHRVPENIPHKDFYYTTKDTDYCPYPPGMFKIVIVHGVNKQPSSSGLYPCVMQNTFSGMDYETYSTPSDAYARLKEINESEGSDAVVAVYQIPYAFTSSGANTTFSQDIVTGRLQYNGLQNNYSKLGTYTPRNKKLFTEEFYGLLCYSSDGQSKQFGYEHFGEPTQPFFYLYDSMVGSPEAAIVPAGYKGVSMNYSEKLICTDFPMCAWASDAYKAWIALNTGAISSTGINATISTATGVGVGIASMLTGNIMGGVASIAGGVSGGAQTAVSLAGEFKDKKALPAQVNGNAGSSLSYAINFVGFQFMQYYLQPDDAERIDKYFDMFGYSVNTIKIPNTYSRPHWNYVKTLNCLIYAVDGDSIPDDDASKICAVYNNGVTFWKNPDEVGQYNLDNSPV